MAQAKKKRDRKPKPPFDLDRGFGPTLRRLRKKAGLTQMVLAEKSELHRTEISLLERGLRNPGLDVVTRLADALDLEDRAEILAGARWKAPEAGKKGRYVYRDAS